MYIVFGATGQAGAATVDAILSRQFPCRAFVRSAEKAGKLREKGCELAVGNVLDRPSVEKALVGVEGIAIFLGGGHNLKTPASAIRQLETEGNRNIIEAAKALGTSPHIVYLSALNCERAHYVVPFAVKLETEGVLKASGLPYTILRPSNFLESLLGDFVQNGTAMLPGPFTNLTSPITVADLGAAAAACFGRADSVGRTYELFGPEKIGYPEFFETWGRLTKPIKIRRIPLGLFKVITTVASPFAPLFPVIYSLLKSFNEFDWSGDPADLEMLLGRKATTIAAAAAMRKGA